MNLREEIGATAEAAGADFFGVADLAPARAAIRQQGGDTLAAFPRAVSLGIALPHAIVDQLPHRTERAVAQSYRHHAYDVINQRLDLLASEVASILQRAGYRVLPLPASQIVDDVQLAGAFSHKLAAHLAGLGWIGRSCMLITPTHGPRVRWATVLTDAPLDPAGTVLAPRCGNCRQCVENCPSQAFTGELFRASDPREVRYDARKCEQYLVKMRAHNARFGVCGMCLYICPHGRRQGQVNSKQQTVASSPQ
jgi:epoxyqueuosine reductase QueG